MRTAWRRSSGCLAALPPLQRAAVQRSLVFRFEGRGVSHPGTGQRIVAPAFLRDYRPDNVVIMNPIYRDEIGRELAGHRCEPNKKTEARR